MKRFKIIPAMICISLLVSSCSVFLDPDPGSKPQNIFDSIWNDFNNTYALFGIKGIDWKAMHNTYVTRITPDMGDRELFTVCSNMLGELNDPPVQLMSPFACYNSGGRFDSVNMEPFSLDLVKSKYLDNAEMAGRGMFTYGTIKSKPSVGYIYISGFANGEVLTGSQDWVKDIDSIVMKLSGTDSLILDIRGNRGGLSSNVDFIAGRFSVKNRNYAQVRTKNGPAPNDFSSPVNQETGPAGTVYKKPIFLITNAQTISGGEWFTLALLSQDHVVHCGSTTCGAFSLSLQRYLVNGWTYTVSLQKVIDMQGICHEGIGISPQTDNYRENTAENLALGIDEQLEFAISINL